MSNTDEHVPDAASNASPAASKANSASGLIVPAVVAGAVALFAAAAAVYVFRGPILDALAAVRDGIFGTFGLGIFPALAWLAVFAFALGWRRGWFRHWRLWLGSVALLAFTLGLLAFFRPAEGALAAFTVGGEVSLGGRAGQAVIGPIVWLGVIRLLAVFVAGAFIAAPPVAIAASVVLGRAAVLCWVGIVVVANAIAALFRNRRKDDERPDDAQPPGDYAPSYAEPAYADTAGYAPASGYAVPSYDYRGLSYAANAGDGASLPSYLPESVAAAARNGEPQPAFIGESAAPVVDDSPPAFIGESAAPVVDDSPPTFIGESAAPVVDDSPPAFIGESAAPSVQDYSQEYDYGDEYLDADDWAANGYGIDDTASGINGGNGNGANGHAEDAAEFDRFAEPYGGPEPRRQPTGNVKFNSLWDAPDADGRPRAPMPPPQAAADFRWTLPRGDFLQNVPEGGVTDEEMRATGEVIQQTLAEYGIEVEMGQTMPGPRVTMYGLVPGWVRRYKRVRATDEEGRPLVDRQGKAVMKREETKTRVKVDSVLSREKDLALALKTPSIRIETPVMGESMIGIEIPNPNPGVVSLRSVMESDEFRDVARNGDLPVALGRGSGGETMVIDLAKMPHLLVAGATGSGKSACLNGIISSLIMEKTPAELRLLLIDPKRVELTPYNGIPHLLTPAIVETDEVVGLLKGMINEMLDRYRKMEEVGVRNIESYNRRMPDKMPMLVVVIDELADLMMSAAFDVEQSLCRLAQLGRATGIHLVVATQRPSVDVVTGLIKANFPSRISFGVTSQIDSRTILDTAGADKLLGRGDMLYLPLDASRPERVQGVFISDGEVEHLVNFWKNTPWGPIPHISLQAAPGEEEAGQDGADSEETDELLDKAINLAMSHNKLSTSLLQRRLRIGYPRAARLMDDLEDRGIVGPSDGSRSRDVIISAG